LIEPCIAGQLEAGFPDGLDDSWMMVMSFDLAEKIAGTVSRSASFTTDTTHTQYSDTEQGGGGTESQNGAKCLLIGLVLGTQRS
jgi:hypothetical protein